MSTNTKPQIQSSQSFIRLSPAVLRQGCTPTTTTCKKCKKNRTKWNMYMKSTKVFQKSIKIYLLRWQNQSICENFHNLQTIAEMAWRLRIDESEMWVSDLKYLMTCWGGGKSVCMKSPIDMNIRFLGSCLTFPPPLFLAFSPQHSRSTWSHLAFLSCG